MSCSAASEAQGRAERMVGCQMDRWTNDQGEKNPSQAASPPSRPCRTGQGRGGQKGVPGPPTTHALHSQWKMLESFQEARDREDHVTQGGTRGCLSGLGGADAT